VANYHTVGTTAITGEDDQSHERFPFKTPVELRESLKTVDAPTAIVFGREGRGLNNEELSQLDEVCSIPADDDYPVLNLGQAATVLLYELRDLTVDETQLPDTAVTRAPEPDVERFHEFFGDFLEATGQREHHRDKNALLVRGGSRAHPTEREIHSLLGTFRKANVKLEHADHLAAKYDEPVYPRVTVDGDLLDGNSFDGDIWAGVRDVSPLLLGIVPFGLVAGIAAVNAGLGLAEAVGMSVIVLFAGPLNSPRSS